MKRRDPLFWIGAVFLAVLVLAAIIVPMVGPAYSKPIGPVFSGPSAEALLGTDRMGRDILVRLMHGARISLSIGIIVQLISLVVGILVGTIGVFGPKFVRMAVMRLTDAMFAFPDILLALLVIAVRGGPSVEAVVIALAVASWPSIARLTYTQIQSLKDREYVVAARAMGASTPYVVVRHILPQLWGIILAVSMVELAATILAESTLSFLGIGIQPPMPSWGNMIDQARALLVSEPVQIVWPCLVLSMTIFALNFVGDGLRARFDPRSR